MPEFRDIKLERNALVKLFRYWKDGRFLKYSSVDIDKIRLFCRGVAETQMMNLLGLSVRALESMESEERDKILSQALLDRLSSGKEEIILRTANSNIWSVVTEVHALVRHVDVWKATEVVLEEVAISYIVRSPVRTTAGLSRKYLFDSRFYTDGTVTGMLIANSVKGLGSLTITKYMEIVTCHNGLVSSDFSDVYSRVHRGDPERVIEEFKICLKEFLSNLSPETQAIDDAKTDIIENAELVISALRIAEKYKAMIRHDFQSQLKEVTRYDLISAISTAAKFAPPTTRLDLEQLAYQILVKKS